MFLLSNLILRFFLDELSKHLANTAYKQAFKFLFGNIFKLEKVQLQCVIQ